MREELIRQSELVPSEILSTPIHVIGAGAVGSFTVLSLAKMGFTDITAYDFDTVEIHNLSSQFFRFSDIGTPKTIALKNLVRDFTNLEIKTQDKYESGLLNGLIITAVDSMGVRQNIWQNHYKKSIGTRYILDPRMSAEFCNLHVVRPMNVEEGEKYSKTIVADEEAVQERCTAKATMYTVNMLAGLVCRTVRDVLANQNYVTQVQWDIKTDEMVAFRKDGTSNLPEIPKPQPLQQMQTGRQYGRLAGIAASELLARDFAASFSGREAVMVPQMLDRIRRATSARDIRISENQADMSFRIDIQSMHGPTWQRIMFRRELADVAWLERNIIESFLEWERQNLGIAQRQYSAMFET